MTRLNGEDAEFRYESDSVGTKAIIKRAERFTVRPLPTKAI